MTADPIRWLWAAVAVALWLGVIAVVAVARARAKRTGAARAEALKGATTGADRPFLVIHASQTGQAEELAWMTARSLSEGGAPVQVLPLGELDRDQIDAAKALLIVASTTGEGDAPDSASRFVRQTMADTSDLTGVEYGLVALGDSSYRDFCGFGRVLDGWLLRSGARALFDRVEVDNGDAGALRHWQHQLAQLTGSAATADWSPPAFDRWRLARRVHLNPGSPGGEAHWLAFEPVDHAPVWAAGDIAEIGLPPGADGASPGSREYSVASLPEDGAVEFIIRRMTGPDGAPGLASGWLTGALAPGDLVDMRIRTNRGFHGPAPETPLVLIGNGTGLAGLRAHWRRRAGRAHGGAWLMFGERTRAHDAFLDDELEAAVADGTLTRLDRVFSRDAGDGRYVQALIEAHAADLRAWVERGAAIYVCGSLEGMSRGVQTALETVLGADRLIELTEAGRYRRDVY